MLKDDTFRGAVNLTTPYAVTNREFSEELGRALHRPSWFRVPGKAIETLLAEGSQPVLGGQRVIPRVLMERGFEWSFPTLPDALRNALAK
jgi:NAD dependent epimerase/dehydratase family enzyme